MLKWYPESMNNAEGMRTSFDRSDHRRSLNHLTKSRVVAIAAIGASLILGASDGRPTYKNTENGTISEQNACVHWSLGQFNTYVSSGQYGYDCDATPPQGAIFD